MTNIWKVLGRSNLQKYIGHETLDRLEQLLPALNENAFSQEKIYSIDGLAGIFDSFLGAKHLSKKELRKELFNKLPPEKMDAALNAIGIKFDSLEVFEKKIDKLEKEWKKEESIEKIFNVLGIPLHNLPKKQQQLEAFYDIPISDTPYKPLKDYQVSIFSEAMRRLGSPRSRFIIQMPTGAGKTRTAMEIITDCFNSSSRAHDNVLWIAHSEELCEQAFTAFIDTWSHVSTKPLRSIRFWGGVRSISYEATNSNFIVSSFQKLHSMLKKDNPLIEKLKNEVSLIIIDEAHKVLAPTYKEVTKSFISTDTKVVGLTATPGRSVVDEEANAALAEFFFNEIVKISPDGESDINFLRKKRVLSSVIYEPLITKLNYTLSGKQKKSLENFLDLPTEFIESLGADDARNLEIIKRLQNEADSGKQILFFSCGVEHSKFITALLGCLDIAAMHIDGSTPRSQRSSAINKFKDKEIRVLCNHGVLSTGFDAPQTDVVFISRPTSSIVLYSQMIGRGLRGPAIGGTETCKVIDVIDNIQGFSNENKVYDYFKDYYENSYE